MRIISKIHDYYDGALRSSVSDKTYTFIRETKDFNSGVYIPSSSGVETKDSEWSISPGVIGFCGEFYPFIEVNKTPKYPCNAKTKVSFHYNIESFNKLNLDIDKYTPKYWGRYWTKKKLNRWLDKGEIEISWPKSLFDINRDPKLKKIFEKEKVAYFVIQNKYINDRHSDKIKQLYPTLQDYKFGKVLDSYTAFQKIEMYLTNVLVKPDEIKQEILDTITDELKAHSHGYDKWSFRTMPKDKK